jgi:hypothetical protein
MERLVHLFESDLGQGLVFLGVLFLILAGVR